MRLEALRARGTAANLKAGGGAGKRDVRRSADVGTVSTAADRCDAESAYLGHQSGGGEMVRGAAARIVAVVALSAVVVGATSLAVATDSTALDLGSVPIPIQACGQLTGQIAGAFLAPVRGDSSVTVVVSCATAGAPVPQLLVFYRLADDGRADAVATYDLDLLGESGHVELRSAKVLDGRFVARLDSSSGPGCVLAKIAATFRVDDGVVVVSDVYRRPVSTICAP